MLRNSLLLLTIAIVLFSCNTSNKEGGEEDVAEIMTVEQLLEKAGDFIDKTIVVEGTVTHVCKHGGKKMFIMGEDEDNTFEIYTGEEVAAFDVSLEGSRVRVEGIVLEERIDEAYLAEWEAEVIEEGSKECETEQKARDAQKKDVDTAIVETEVVDSIQDPTIIQINEMRKEIAEGGKGYISFYSLECTNYEEIK